MLCAEQEVAKGNMMQTMQLQHAKQVAKMRQEMQLTVQQTAEKNQLRMHEYREQQAGLYRQRTQTVEDRNTAHIQVSAHPPYLDHTTCAALWLYRYKRGENIRGVPCWHAHILAWSQAADETSTILVHRH